MTEPIEQKAPRYLNVGDLIGLLMHLVDEKEVTSETPVLGSIDEEGNGYGRLFGYGLNRWVPGSDGRGSDVYDLDEDPEFPTPSGAELVVVLYPAI